MLSNAYFLAKFGFDTAENEPVKNLQNFAKFANFAAPNPLTLTRAAQANPGAAPPPLRVSSVSAVPMAVAADGRSPPPPLRVCKILQIFANFANF